MGVRTETIVFAGRRDATLWLQNLAVRRRGVEHGVTEERKK